MISNTVESFQIWCNLNTIATVFEATFLYFSIMAFLKNLRDFWVFAFEYRSEKENPIFTENVYFLVFKAQMNGDLFFDHYFSF